MSTVVVERICSVGGLGCRFECTNHTGCLRAWSAVQEETYRLMHRARETLRNEREDALEEALRSFLQHGEWAYAKQALLSDPVAVRRLYEALQPLYNPRAGDPQDAAAQESGE